jgi:NAD(P)-dependent dehydrogenase (short-subunit alcohol dehydrogenase family)
MGNLLSGKVALVTGGGRGIGRATALLMAGEGARVAVADISEDSANDTAQAIKDAGGHSIAMSSDVTKAQDVDALVADVVETMGRLDCACNNAGISPMQAGGAGKRTADWPEEAFDRILSVNLKGVWYCMRAELNQMMERSSIFRQSLE